MKVDSQSTISSLNNKGARERASVPTASTKSARPFWILLIAESIACMPEAQLRMTVQAGTLSPVPIRKPTTRPILVSSGLGAAQPTITSLNSVAAKGWRSIMARALCTARSAAEKGPRLLRTLRNGVRLPSTIYTGLNDINIP